MDGAVSESFLSLVDDKLTTSEGTVKSELRNGKSITSRSRAVASSFHDTTLECRV